MLLAHFYPCSAIGVILNFAKVGGAAAPLPPPLPLGFCVLVTDFQSDAIRTDGRQLFGFDDGRFSVSFSDTSSALSDTSPATR